MSKKLIIHSQSPWFWVIRAFLSHRLILSLQPLSLLSWAVCALPKDSSQKWPVVAEIQHALCWWSHMLHRSWCISSSMVPLKLAERTGNGRIQQGKRRFVSQGVRCLLSLKQSPLLLRCGREPWVTEANWRGIPLQDKPPNFFLMWKSTHIRLSGWVGKPERKSTWAVLNQRLSPWPREVSEFPLSRA